MTSPTRRTIGGSGGGKYERLRVLGHGASGIVYLAYDTVLHHHVALKEIRGADREEIDRLLREARLQIRLRHPHIVAVHTADVQSDGAVLIDMELVRGRNLAEHLRERQQNRITEPMPVGESLFVAFALLDALQYAHEQSIVHCDIKPANVLIGENGVVKIADFGLAVALGSGSNVRGGGTYPYMAPEDFSGTGIVSDRTSDLWSVAVLLYEMLCGRRPFAVNNSKDPFEWKQVIETAPIPPPSSQNSNVPAAMNAVFLRALSRNKDERYSTARAFADALSAAAPAVSPSPPVLPPMFDDADDVEEEPQTMPAPGAVGRNIGNASLGFPAASRVAENPPTMATIAAPPHLAASAAPTLSPSPSVIADASESVAVVRSKNKVASDALPRGVGWWYWPLLLLCAAPPGLVLTLASRNQGQLVNVLTAWTLTGLFCALFFLIAVGARLPVWSRILPLLPVGVGLAAGGGLVRERIGSVRTPDEAIAVLAVAVTPIIGLMLVSLTAQRAWRFWAALLGGVAIAAALIFGGLV